MESGGSGVELKFSFLGKYLNTVLDPPIDYRPNKEQPKKTDDKITKKKLRHKLWIRKLNDSAEGFLYEESKKS